MADKIINFTIDTSKKFLRAVLWFVLLIYLAILCKFIFFKPRLGSISKHFEYIFHHYDLKKNIDNGFLNLKPFDSIKFYLGPNMPLKYSLINLVGNIAGFVPLGIIFPLLFIRLRSAAATIFAVFLVSFCFEITQLFAMLGVCDVDDLILNTTGGIIGYLFFILLKKIILIK